MAYFEPAIITSAGMNLVANDIAGIENIEFVKLVSGSGEYTEEEKSRTALMERTELKEQKQEFDFNTIEVKSEKSVLLKSVISNRDLQEGYRITEIGVYARKKGTEGDGILYSVALAIEHDFLPPFNGLNPSEIIQEYYATVSNAENVTIVAKTGAYALQEDLEKLQGSMGNNMGYNSTALYKVGDYCIHENKLYRCIVAIEEAEEWTAEHWEETNVIKEFQILQNKEVEVVDPMTTTEEGFAADAKLTGDALKELNANMLVLVSFDPETGTLITKSADYQETPEIQEGEQ